LTESYEATREQIEFFMKSVAGGGFVQGGNAVRKIRSWYGRKKTEIRRTKIVRKIARPHEHRPERKVDLPGGRE